MHGSVAGVRGNPDPYADLYLSENPITDKSLPAYARVDLTPEAFEGEIIEHGTTNVDFDPPMRAADEHESHTNS
jgi:hypothetical protein